MYRVGIGYDVHRLTKGRSLILGGIQIPHLFGLMGHSDADALTHAIIDAILGALSRGDIGQHFPDTDPSYKDTNSLSLLTKVVEWVREEGFRINNVDTNIIAEKPKLAPYIPGMREKLSKVLDIEIDRISIKAKTSEGLGFCGLRRVERGGFEVFRGI